LESIANGRKNVLRILSRHSGLFSKNIAAPLTAAIALCFPVAIGAQEPQQADLYLKRMEWTAVGGNSANVSHFLYRDLNRTGSYDVGDRPLVNVAVIMRGPGGGRVIRRSNIHGFVNFTNSLSASDVDVDRIGEYIFEVQIPPGWEMTGGDKLQALVYEARPETRPGIVADRVPVPIGLAPILRIEGRVAPGSADDTIVTASGPNGTTETLQTDREGNFATFVQPGEWMITATSRRNGLTVERHVNVENAPVRLSTLHLDQDKVPRKGERLTLDFEDITASDITKIPNGYGGLKWNTAIVTQNEFYRGEGYINNTISGSNIMYNSSGYPVSIERDGGFDFYGGYFGVAWFNAEGETLEVKAWRDAELVGSEEFELSSLGPFWFDADYRNITRLELSTRHYWQFVADDLFIGIDSAAD
jgi:hypothetical protein